MIHGGAMYSTKYINTANTNHLFSAQSELNVSKSPPLLNGFIEACVLQFTCDGQEEEQRRHDPRVGHH